MDSGPRVAAAAAAVHSAVLLASALGCAAQGAEPAGPGAGARWFVVALGAFVVALGVWLGRVFVVPDPPGSELSRGGKTRRAFGALAVALGAFVLLAGISDDLEPDHGAAADPDATAPGSGAWETSFDGGLARARETGTPVIVDCWAEWCKACKTIFRDTLEHEDVKRRLRGFTRIKLDMERPENEPLWERLAIGGNLPWVAVFDSVADLETAPPRPRFVIREDVGPEDFLRRMKGEGAPSTNAISDWLAQKGLFVTLLLVFLAGVAASFTPCVVPVYILTVNVIGTRATSSLLGRLGLSSIYVLGLVLTYTVLGVVAGLTTSSMGAAFQSPWVVGGLAALFILLALFYLEVFRMPQGGGLAARITQSSHSNVLTAFLLGLAGGLIAAPCVGPLLAGILAYIGERQDAWLGFWLMFTFAVGMGLLFIGLGTSTALLDRVRKMGAWGYRLEIVFAVVFLAIGVYYLRLVVPAIGDLIPALASLSPF